MANTITFFDLLTEDAQTWLLDEKGKPIEPENPTDKPFHIYNVDGTYKGISKDTYEVFYVVYEDVLKKKK